MPEQAYAQNVSTIPHGDVHAKPVRWVGTSRDDLREFPDEVQRKVGGALWDAQIGEKSTFAKPLRGF